MPTTRKPRERTEESAPSNDSSPANRGSANAEASDPRSERQYRAFVEEHPSLSHFSGPIETASAFQAGVKPGAESTVYSGVPPHTANEIVRMTHELDLQDICEAVAGRSPRDWPKNPSLSTGPLSYPRALTDSQSVWPNDQDVMSQDTAPAAEKYADVTFETTGGSFLDMDSAALDHWPPAPMRYVSQTESAYSAHRLPAQPHGALARIGDPTLYDQPGHGSTFTPQQEPQRSVRGDANKFSYSQSEGEPPLNDESDMSYQPSPSIGLKSFTRVPKRRTSSYVPIKTVEEKKEEKRIYVANYRLEGREPKGSKQVADEKGRNARFYRKTHPGSKNQKSQDPEMPATNANSQHQDADLGGTPTSRSQYAQPHSDVPDTTRYQSDWSPLKQTVTEAHEAPTLGSELATYPYFQETPSHFAMPVANSSYHHESAYDPANLPMTDEPLVGIDYSASDLPPIADIEIIPPLESTDSYGRILDNRALGRSPQRGTVERDLYNEAHHRSDPGSRGRRSKTSYRQPIRGSDRGTSTSSVQIPQVSQPIQNRQTVPSQVFGSLNVPVSHSQTDEPPQAVWEHPYSHLERNIPDGLHHFLVKPSEPTIYPSSDPSLPDKFVSAEKLQALSSIREQREINGDPPLSFNEFEEIYKHQKAEKKRTKDLERYLNLSPEQKGQKRHRRR